VIDRISKLDERRRNMGMRGWLVAVAVAFLFSGCVSTQDVREVSEQPEDLYYARCNLKVLDDNSISWINWQATSSFVKAGARLNVLRDGHDISIVEVDSGRAYRLEPGSDREEVLEKFVTRTPLDLSGYDAAVQKNIRLAVGKVGMTKEQVYMAMGPPAKIGTAVYFRWTRELTLAECMEPDVWTYFRKKGGVNITFYFDPSTGVVKSAEGLWEGKPAQSS